MTWILAVGVVACIPALLTLAVLYARAVRQEATESLRAGESALALANCQAELQAAVGQQERLQGVVERYQREIKGLQDLCITSGDPAAIRSRLDDLLMPGAGEGDGGKADPAAGPVPDWVTADSSR